MNRYLRMILLKGLFFYDIFGPPLIQKLEVRTWQMRGGPIPPPPAVKRRTVIAYARRFSLDTLVETGTYLGDMVSATRKVFKQIFSIELDKDLYERSKRKFAAFPHIHLYWGDSSAILPKLLDSCDSPCLFWLDAHFSGGFTAKGGIDTPILYELDTIFSHPVKNHVVLIDDARCFNGEDNYPTIKEVRDLVKDQRPEWTFEVRQDIIRVHNEFYRIWS